MSFSNDVKNKFILEFAIWREKHFDAIQFSIYDIVSILKEQIVSHTELDLQLEIKMTKNVQLDDEQVEFEPSTLKTVRGNALRAE